MLSEHFSKSDYNLFENYNGYYYLWLGIFFPTGSVFSYEKIT